MQNLFESLGLAPGFELDAKVLEQAYFAAQRACHPDRFVGKPEAERVAAISRSQRVNDAYDTLKNPLSRAEYLLELQGMPALKDGVPVPPELLMEMMELREQLAEAAGEGAAIAHMVAHIKTLHANNLKALSAAFAAADYPLAARETQRLQYLAKAMEEAHMRFYRLKAEQA